MGCYFKSLDLLLGGNVLDLNHGLAVAQSLSRIRYTLLKGNHREIPLAQMLHEVRNFKSDANGGAVSAQAIQRILQTSTTLALQKHRGEKSIQTWIEGMPRCGRFIVNGWPPKTKTEMAAGETAAKKAERAKFKAGEAKFRAAKATEAEEGKTCKMPTTNKKRKNRPENPQEALEDAPQDA
jgi:hypothetical protein